jgi:hypothetical protein
MMDLARAMIMMRPVMMLHLLAWMWTNRKAVSLLRMEILVLLVRVVARSPNMLLRLLLLIRIR